MFLMCFWRFCDSWVPCLGCFDSPHGIGMRMGQVVAAAETTQAAVNYPRWLMKFVGFLRHTIWLFKIAMENHHF